MIIGSDYYEHYLQLRVTLLTLKIFSPERVRSHLAKFISSKEVATMKTRSSAEGQRVSDKLHVLQVK